MRHNKVNGETEAAYDEFAGIYDKVWSRHVARDFIRALDKLILRELPAGAIILDACCGTGKIANLMLKRGFRVVGFDASTQMLRHAARRAPAADFFQARIEDEKSFDDFGSENFDAAVCVFDSLNHLSNVRQLEAALGNVRRVMKPGAAFVFDLNMEAAFHARWQEHFNIIESDTVVAVQGVYDADTRRASYDFTVFQLIKNQWRRSEFAINERCFTPTEITRAVRRAGFASSTAHDAERHLGLRGHTGRMFFVARA